MKHPNQNKGAASFTPHRTIGLPTHVPTARVPGFTDEQTAKRDAEELVKVQAQRLSKPPHRHVYAGDKCKVCGLAEVTGVRR